MIGFTEYVLDLERRGEGARARARVTEELVPLLAAGRVADVEAWLRGLDASRLSAETAAHILDTTASVDALMLARAGLAKRLEAAQAQALREAAVSLPLLTAADASRLSASSSETTEQRLGRAAPVLRSAIEAIRTAAASGARGVTLEAEPGVADVVVTALSLAGFAAGLTRDPGRISVSWEAP